MNEIKPNEIKREEYKPYPYEIPRADLNFLIYDDHVIVQSRLHLSAKSGQKGAPVVLDGQKLELLSLKIDGRDVPDPDYLVSADHLIILSPPPKKNFTVETEVKIDPYRNDSGTGLNFTAFDNGKKIGHWTQGLLSTQCESQSFRKITYFPDRPDVLSRFRVRIEADWTKYPVLLSNPDLVQSGALQNNRRFAIYEDLKPKPCYIFALVAGDLKLVSDTFETKSGRMIELRYYVEPGKEDLCRYALSRLKNALKWVEDNLGLEYAPASYYTVVVKRFNFGAMENIGLNIFVERYALANPLTATDLSYLNIDRVVAHESFHTWFGDEVTCAAWSEIALKEGLVSLLDQIYSADQTNEIIGRIENVARIKTASFPKDDGPLAIPVIPKKWIDPENNYNVTTYNKGAEVNRMIMTMIGRKKFMSACREWISRYSGQARWIEDFVALMQAYADIDLAQFAETWYHQPGTPQVEINTLYDPAKHTFAVIVDQSCPASPSYPAKKPFHVPLKIALLAKNGQEIPLRLSGAKTTETETEMILHLRQARETFVFTDIKEDPIPSFNRNFSAPIKLHYANDSREKMAFRMACDTDPFNMHEAGQTLFMEELENIIAARSSGRDPEIDPLVLEAFGDMLTNKKLDKGFLALALALPSETEVAERMAVLDFEAAHNARQYLKKRLALAYEREFLNCYRRLISGARYEKDWASVCERDLKNTALSYLAATGKAEYIALAKTQFEKADNPTDKIAAINAINDIDCPERNAMLNKLYEDWQGDNLGVYKWLSLNAASIIPDTLNRLTEIEKDPKKYDPTVPTCVYSLWGGLSANNLLFHNADGSGYRAIADRIIEIGQFNAMVAVHLINSFEKINRLDANRRSLVRAELKRVVDVLTEKIGKIPSQILDPIEKILKLN